MSKISDLAQALYRKTADKKVQWEVQDDSSIYMIIGKNSVFIKKDENEYTPFVRISIFNVEGIKVDEEFFYPRDENFAAMEEVMTKARRNLLRADETLDEILTRVNDL